VDAEPLVGFVGTLRPWHDVATLVGAIELLRARGNRAQLLVVGDGTGAAALDGPGTLVTGPVPNEHVPAYLAALDAAVVPYTGSRCYFSPLKLFEYLAAAVPVVAADAGDVRHCIRHGVSGRLYAPGDAAALARELELVLTSPHRARQMAAAGREHVCAHHTWAQNARIVAGRARAELPIRGPA
jgi:glycosyltransferase involved in cell wall biosynthesis